VKKYLVHGLLLMTWITLFVTGCGHARPEDKVLAELANLDKETIYSRAQDLYDKRDYEESRKLFSFVYDSFPNDPLGHKAALRVADTYANRRNTASLTEARLRYQDFANRYPNDPDRDYALLMIGDTYTKRKLHPDRDLSALHDALDAYQQLVNLYPNSKYSPEAEKKISELRELLAQHEWQVASFYLKNKMWRGALWRLQYLKENYPGYSAMDEVDGALERAQGAIDQQEEQIKKYRERLKESDQQSS
jgi:outer membrane assembly lipoprotein YfiO